MRSIGLIFVGYLIVCPHVFYSWRDLIWRKGKKTQRDRRNLQWNVGLGTLSLMLLGALTVETFRNEFSLNWIIYISSFIALLLFWSIKFMRVVFASGKG
jgi:hypothetical protein